jgi:hypothetical protein
VNVQTYYSKERRLIGRKASEANVHARHGLFIVGRQHCCECTGVLLKREASNWKKSFRGKRTHASSVNRGKARGHSEEMN